jgi:hypothetical protein
MLFVAEGRETQKESKEGDKVVLAMELKKNRDNNYS